MKRSNMTARRIYWLAGIAAVALLATSEIGAQRATTPSQKRSAPMALTIVDQDGRPVPNTPPSATSQIFDVTVGPGGVQVFSPAMLNISAGDTVRWAWDSLGHSVTSGPSCTADSQFCSPDDMNCPAGILSGTGTVYQHTFTQAGTYTYFCAAHCLRGMVGSITVAAPTPTPAPTPSPTATATATIPPSPSPTPSTFPTIIISGTVSYCTNPVPGPVPNVTMTLSGAFSGSTLTDASGNYSFMVQANADYTVTPTKAARAPGTGNINTVDVIGVQKQFLTGTFLTGCKLAAADVNNDTVVNTQDVIAVQRFFSGFTNAIANVGKYKFTPASRSYTQVFTNQTGQNYDTIVFGDVATPFSELAEAP